MLLSNIIKSRWLKEVFSAVVYLVISIGSSRGVISRDIGVVTDCVVEIGCWRAVSEVLLSLKLEVLVYLFVKCVPVYSVRSLN